MILPIFNSLRRNCRRLERVPLIAIMVCVSGCATYYIPVESFKQQFVRIDSASLRDVKINVPVMIAGVGTNSYRANPIDTIACVDSDNRPVRLANSPSIEIRITQQNDARTIFYFDTVYLQDSLIVGARSRFLPSLRDSVPLNTVKLIEVQDSKKDFHYVKSTR
jgi:hypothetical protein